MSNELTISAFAATIAADADELDVPTAVQGDKFKMTLTVKLDV